MSENSIPEQVDTSDAAVPMRGSLASRLLPQSRFVGPIPWVIAILIALVVNGAVMALRASAVRAAYA